MDPLSALALSCNVLDVITTAGKTCAFLSEVHKAGAFPNHDELISTTSLLDKSAQALAQQLSTAPSASQTGRADDKELLDVSQKARRLASDVQKKLEALKLQTTDSPHRRLEKLVKTVLQKGKIYDLQRRWEELRKAVDSALLVRLSVDSEKNTTHASERFDDLARRVTQGLSHLNDISIEMKHQSDKSRHIVTAEAQSTRVKVSVEAQAGRQHTSQEAAKNRAVFEAEARRIRQHITTESASGRGAFDSKLRHAHRSTVGHLGRRIDIAHRETRSHLQNQLESMQREDLDERIRLQFINSFRIPELNERRNQITDAHSGTYEWIFEGNLETSDSAPTIMRRSWDSFTDWLLSSSTMYWIHGKAGSGKSTLMHFISEHEKTRKLLDKWAKPQTPIILSWYFWNSGSQAQRSLKGALCALLYQLVSIQPGIVTDFLRTEPHLSGREAPADWSQADLINLVSKMFSTFNGRVAVFLDGLDEFDRDEDVKALLALLQSLTKSSSVKVCLSSRPEPQLELELGHLPQLRLQDMTSRDMSQYISDRLRPALPHLTSAEVDDFVEQIACKADGVFLWVYLVTKSLRQGALHSDSYDVLRERLELLPAKMEILYEHMWRSLNGDDDLPTYRRQAALFFSFYAHFPLSLIDFVLATDEDLCEAASDMAKDDAVIERLYQACSQMKSLLQTRCAGLLELGPQESTNAWRVMGAEPVPNLSTTESETGTNGDDETARLLRALKSLGAVRFFHRTARDFLLDKSAGQAIIKTHPLSEQDSAERVLRARLAARICGLYHPSLFRSREIWRSYEGSELSRMVDLILELDKSDADEQVAEFQYRLLQHIEITYSQKLLPKWDNFIDQACRRNWYLAIASTLGLIDLSGMVMCRAPSSALAATILRNGPRDKEFATYLLYEQCCRKSYRRADIRLVQVLLSAGANPNASDVLCPRDGFQHSLWHQFVIGFMELEQDKPADYNGQAMQAQTIATVKCFLHHGADLFQQLVVVRSCDMNACTDTIKGIETYFENLDSWESLASGNAISTVNGAYLLRQLSLKFPSACREGNLAEFTMPGGLPPLCRDLAIVGTNWALYRLPQDGPDLWTDTISGGRENFEGLVSNLDMRYPQLFPRHRRVQMRTLLGEQAFAPEPETQFEHGDSWIDRMKWSRRHLEARRALKTLDPYNYPYYHIGKTFKRTLSNIDIALFHLSTFRDQFGLLTESTLPRDEIEAVEKSFWPSWCETYDEFRRGATVGNVNQDPSKPYTLDELDSYFNDLTVMLRLHGFKNLGSLGTRFALNEEGRGIPGCREVPRDEDLALIPTQERASSL